MLRAVTDEIMYAVMNLSGQEYVDEYAQRAKKRAKSGDAAEADGAMPLDGAMPPDGAVPLDGAAQPDGTAKPGSATPALSPAGEDQAPPAKNPIP